MSNGIVDEWTNDDYSSGQGKAIKESKNVARKFTIALKEQKIR